MMMMTLSADFLRARVESSLVEETTPLLRTSHAKRNERKKEHTQYIT